MAAVMFAGISCAMLAAPVNAGFVVSNGVSPGESIVSPMDVLSALGFAGSQDGDYLVEGPSNESASCETQNAMEKPACATALPMEQPVPFQTPMSNGLDLASSGPGFTGSRTSRSSSDGGSAGLLNESSELSKPLRSNRRHWREFQFIPAAPLFELLHPS